MSEIQEWIWRDYEGKGILKNKLLLKEGFEHGFFNRKWEETLPKELSKSFNKTTNALSLKQVHGNQVIYASNTMIYNLQEADGIVSNLSTKSVWVYTADCIPALIADPKNGHVAACHAGWRGVANRVLLKTIDKLEKIGAYRENIIVVLGPSISRDNYQIGLEVAEEISNSLEETSNHLDNKHHKQESIDMVSLGITKIEGSNNKIKLDLKAAAAKQLQDSGIDISQISICPFCTFSEKELFHSWRRDKVKAVQWSGIAARS